jgi:predicted nucleic acid-binding Zn ribbon protein
MEGGEHHHHNGTNSTHDEAEESWLAGHSVVVMHGACMLAAFGFCFNVGSVLGRYFKKPPRDVFPGKWFPVHVTLQSTGLALALLAAILIVAHISYDKGLRGHLGGIHQILGVFVLLGAFIQPFFGTLAHRHFLRFKLPSKWHPPHRWIGRATMLLSIVTIALGMAEISEHVVPIDAVMWFSFASMLVVITMVISYGEWSTPADKPPERSLEMEALSIEGDAAMMSDSVRSRVRDTSGEDDDGESLYARDETEKPQPIISMLAKEIAESNTRRTSRLVLFVYSLVMLILVGFMISYISMAYANQTHMHSHAH